MTDGVGRRVRGAVYAVLVASLLACVWVAASGRSGGGSRDGKGMQASSAPEADAPGAALQTSPGSDDVEGGDGCAVFSDDDCPVMAGGGAFEQTAENALGRGWRSCTDADVSEVAREILAQLESGGYKLLEASRMDLFGEAWGCVASRQEDSCVVVAVLLPERMGGTSDEEVSTRVLVARLGLGT